MSSRLSTAGTFNSLSRDHVKLALLALASRLNLDTFNSLSRDHPGLIPTRSSHLPYLSTPSLGITREIEYFVPQLKCKICFQLPLSGSLASFIGSRKMILAFFQLPLSGSLHPRRHVYGGGAPRVRLSTPSLGITSGNPHRPPLLGL